MWWRGAGDEFFFGSDCLLIDRCAFLLDDAQGRREVGGFQPPLLLSRCHQGGSRRGQRSAAGAERGRGEGGASDSDRQLEDIRGEAAAAARRQSDTGKRIKGATWSQAGGIKGAAK